MSTNDVTYNFNTGHLMGCRGGHCDCEQYVGEEGRKKLKGSSRSKHEAAEYGGAVMEKIRTGNERLKENLADLDGRITRLEQADEPEYIIGDPDDRTFLGNLGASSRPRPHALKDTGEQVILDGDPGRSSLDLFGKSRGNALIEISKSAGDLDGGLIVDNESTERENTEIIL